MKIHEAQATIRDAAIELSTMPSELAHAVHAKAAGVHPHEVEDVRKPDGSVIATKSDVWAQARAKAVDPDELPGLSAAVGALTAAITKVKACYA